MILRSIFLYITVFLSVISNGQSIDTSFQKEWTAIDTMIILHDRTQSVLDLTKSLYKKAKEQHLEAQVIKTLIYQYTLEERLAANASGQGVDLIKAEIATTKDKTALSILYSLLAKRYQQFFETHRRWNLYAGRTQTAVTVSDDITTWTLPDFTAAITRNYQLSLADAGLLQQQDTRAYDAILVKGNDKHPISLYDLLAKEALDYFKSNEYNVTRPAQVFMITDDRALGTIDQYTKSPFRTVDTSSHEWLALELYRKLLLFHRNDADKYLLTTYNLERIEWVAENAVFPGSQQKHRMALEEITRDYGNTSSSAMAWYYLANIQNTRAEAYQPFEDTAGRYGYKMAEEIIHKALPMYDSRNTGAVSMRNLLFQINRKELSTQTERVNVPSKPFRALVRFRNIDTLFARIIPITDYDPREVDMGGDYWEKLSGFKSIKTFRQVLPTVNDHQAHTTEIKIDGLPVGQYALLSCSADGFNAKTDKMSVQFFYVSNISVIKNKSDFFVVNRDNGKPVGGAAVTIYKYAYNNSLKKTTSVKVAEKQTDAIGFFRFTDELSSGNYRYDIRKNKDRLYLKENDYIVYENTATYEDNETEVRYEGRNSSILFFTDRSIYRPGQIVQFKGIGIIRDPKTKLSRLITAKDSIRVYLNDVNGKKIDSAMFSLNSYGSFHGSFHLPAAALTGIFSITAQKFNSSLTSFSVEEYKRPGFQVTLEKAKGAYRLGDSVVITGYAKAFAGNNIDGAGISYIVSRSGRSILSDYSFRKSIPGPLGATRTITSGSLTTDAQGQFMIRFKASAEDIVKPDSNLTFNFTVSVNLTDNNGETRMSTLTTPAGYRSIILNLTAPVTAAVDSIQKIPVYATNLSNEKVTAQVHIRVLKLLPPAHVFRKRYWQRPDQFVMNRKEFTAYFPTDEYEEETNYRTWPVEQMVQEEKIDTHTQEFFTISGGALSAGYYKIEASSTDAYGQQVTTAAYTQLFDLSSAATSMYQFNHVVKGSVEPGETASFISASNAPHLYVISRTDKGRGNSDNYQLSERDNKHATTLAYTATENDRGGVFISEAYVYDNRIYTHQYTVNVPWTNKTLQIQYASYRDKTEPGNGEKWTVTVQTDKSEKAAAELLTGMYDASLDQFRQHNWRLPSVWPTTQAKTFFTGYQHFRDESSNENYIPETDTPAIVTVYDRLASDGSELWYRNSVQWINDSTGNIRVVLQPSRSALHEVVVGYGKQDLMTAGVVSKDKTFNDSQTIAIRGRTPMAVDGAEIQKADTPPAAITQVRKNFNETAFFFPQLYADSMGQYSFSFTMPDALTQWKWMSLAHTRELAFGSSSTTIVTQKKLMVQSNAPRFMREGDNMEFSTKLSNLTDKEITGQVSFELFDPATHTSVDGWFQNVFPSQYFTVAAGQSFAVKFPLQVPFNYNRPLGWRVVARSGNMSDGEENILPVLTNRVLVTESLPLLLQGDTTQRFVFDKLLKNGSESLTQQGLTVEYTSNPAWYAVKALPYLIEYPYECAEQTFNRFYANTLAAFIVNKQPAIRQVFEEWKKDSSSLKSNLQKNEELKQVILQETPWVLEAESEATQRKNLAVLFDMATINAQKNNFLEKLSQQQLPGGGFAWFKGGNDDRYITNYIVTGIGKLRKLGAIGSDLTIALQPILTKAMGYLDARIKEDYNSILKSKTDTNLQQVGTTQIEYLYMRSFFGDILQPSPAAWQYFYKQARQYWIKQNTYYRAQLGLVAFRNRDDKFATTTILPSLLENTVSDSRQGMYWKEPYAGWWYRSPIEHQSMMIAFMSEIAKDAKGESLLKPINAMKTWLLLNKQTNNWRTTIATADACYALLLNGSDWLSNKKTVTIQLGNYTVSSNTEKTEAGTGYLKKRIDGRMVSPAMGNITVSTVTPGVDKRSAQPSWGNVYWQYFEDMDKVTSAGGPLSVVKKLFVEHNTNKGKQLEAIADGQELQTGDKVVIRMELRSDRDMDYLHLKDTRAAGMEPVNVLSGYKWQDGLGYYESTKDASSNFFISHLAKGTYIFEYPVFITHSGVFSAGIATIQCMYAPEFTSHSAGLKIRVAN